VPALAGILGMILFSQSSDRTGERVWHLVVPLLIGGSALMFAGASIGISAPLTIAAFALAVFGISGSLPVFWNLPTAFLGASAAASGIAFINSVGNVSGYAAPQLVGVLHDFSGSYRMPMLVMGAMVMVAGILVPLATRLRPQRQRSHRTTASRPCRCEDDGRNRGDAHRRRPSLAEHFECACWIAIPDPRPR
jgi:MFS transporter, ACS family, tartrate transporter